MKTFAPVEAVARDARYALRVLRKTPAFTATAIATLAVAIAANAAVFSIVDGVLLKPLPYPDSARLGLVSATIGGEGPERQDTSHTGRTWELIHAHATSVERAVFSGWTMGVNVVANGRASHVQQQRVGAGFFDVLGIPPLVGRGFTEEEDRAGGPAAVILSHDLWTSVFGADPSVLGRTLTLRGEPATIVGVMPTGFNSGYDVDVWTPLRASREGEGEGENYSILVRLEEGTSWSQAAAQIASIAQPIVDDQRGRPQRALGFSIAPLQDVMTQTLRTPLLMLWAAVGIVLLVAAVNLAGLLLARTARRSREIATRMALGSGRATVVRQLLVESAVLAALGTAFGVLLGYVAIDVLLAAARNAVDVWQPVALDGRVVAITAVLAAAATSVFGLAPALQASRIEIQPALLESGARSVAGGAARWPRRLVVVAQVALGVMLLAGAGLLVRTFAELKGLNPGFDGRGVMTGSISMQDARYGTGARVRQTFDATVARLRQEPGVESAAVSLGLPYERLLNLGFRRLDGARATGMTSATYVTPEYFSTLRLPVLRGRAFDQRDTSQSTGVAIVSETFARTYYPGEDALGRRIAFAGAEREIVGIAGDVQVRPGWGSHGPLAAMPLAYVPVTQVSDGMVRLVHGWFSPVVIVRGSRTDLPDAMRRALAAADPLLPFASMRPMEDVQANAIARQRFLMMILSALAATAVLLAAVGIHGLIATTVTERTREIGIRLALGATIAQALRSLALPGVVLATIGTLIGIAGALAFVRLLRGFLFGVGPTDPLTFAATAAVLLTVATIASIVPALRILRLDPARTLRQE